MFVGVELVLLCLCVFSKGDNNFPSLLTTNASLAIIIDREYVGEDFENIKTDIENFLIYAKREVLKHGGLNHFFFSWTAINVKRDFSAIFSITSCSETWRLYHFADKEHIFHMALTETNCPRLPPEKAIAIPIIRKGEELSQVLLDLRTLGIFNWKSLVIMYDETLGKDMSTNVIQSMTQRSTDDAEATSISMIKFGRNISRTDVKNILSTIRQEVVGRNYMAVVNYGLVGTIMEYAKGFGLVHTKSQWMFVISDTNDEFHDIQFFKKLLKEGDNIAFVYNTTRNSDTCTGGRRCQIEELLTAFFKGLDLAVINEYETASQVSDEEWEAIRPTKVERREFLHNAVKNYLAQYSVCDNCTFWQIETGDTWGVEYQNIGDIANPQLLFAGTWRPTDGPTMKDKLFIHISHGFRGKLLPMVSFHNPPWQILKFNESGEVIEYGGLVFDVINELSRNLNFTFRVDVVKVASPIINSSLTTKETNLKFEGYLTNEVPPTLLEMVKNKTVALGACAVTVTDEYKAVVNYTIPISTQTYTFIAARPRELSRALLFTSPFRGDTWFCLAAAIVSMGPCLYVIHRFSPVYEYKGFPKKGGLSSIQNCIWYMYGALLQQGGMHLPYADSARVVVGAWWLVVLIISTTYCGNLVAFLTFPKIDIPITTIDDMIAHKDIVTWSFREGNFLEYELKIANEPRFRALYEGRRKYRLTKDAVDEVASGKHVIIDWKMKLQYIMKNQFLETGRCEFVLGLDDFVNEQLAFIIAQDTPYLVRINEEIKRLHQVGLIEKWLKDYLPKRDKCWKNRHIIEVNNHTVNMDDMQGSFFVLIFGFVLATVWLGFEKIWAKHFGKRKKKAIKPFIS